MEQFKYELGVKAEDLVTGFKGIIISRSQWLTGCNTYGVKPKVNKDGTVREAVWFDENAIKVTTNKPIKIGKSVDGKKGGPQETPMQSNR